MVQDDSFALLLLVSLRGRERERCESGGYYGRRIGKTRGSLLKGSLS